MTVDHDTGRDIVLKAADARVCGFCGRGQNIWGADKGITVRGLLAGEYTVGMAEDMNDAMANRIAAAARKRVSGG